MPDFSSLLQSAKKLAEKIREISNKDGQFLIITRPSADGFSSASILGKAIAREGGTFTIKFIDLALQIPPSLGEFSSDLTIILDQGEDLTNQLRGVIDTEVSVIDHHEYAQTSTGNNIIASEFGFNGSREVSTSTLSYLIAKALSEGNVELGCLALVGSMGKHQDYCRNRSFCGLNEALSQELSNLNFIEIREEPHFLGKSYMPIFKSIAYSVEPIIYGLSGRPETVKAVLEKSGIKLKREERWRTYEELSDEEKGRIVDLVHSYIGNKTHPQLLTSTSYILKNEDEHTPLREVRDFAYLLNALRKEPSLGISIAMGKRGEEVERAMHLLHDYLKMLIDEQISISTDKRRMIRRGDNVVLISGEGTVSDYIIDDLSFLLSITNDLKDKLIILKTIIGADGVVSIRKGLDFRDDISLFNILHKIGREFKIKTRGTRDYATAVVPIDKLNLFIDSLEGEIQKS